MLPGLSISHSIFRSFPGEIVARSAVLLATESSR